MTQTEDRSDRSILVAIDVAKLKNDVVFPDFLNLVSDKPQLCWRRQVLAAPTAESVFVCADIGHG